MVLPRASSKRGFLADVLVLEGEPDRSRRLRFRGLRHVIAHDKVVEPGSAEPPGRV
jgi:hypothetical protein